MVQPTHRSVFVRVVVPLLLLTLTMPSVAAAQSGIRAYILGIASAGPGAEAQIVTVLDTTTNAVVTTIPAGAGCTCLVDAERMAISPDGTRLYVVSSNKATNQDSILIIRTASNTVIDTISIDRIANTVVVSPSGGRLYVASWSPSGQSLMVLDTATKATITSIPSGDGGRGMAISPDGSRIYTSGIDTIGSTYYPRIKVFDTTTNVQLPAIDVAASYPSTGVKGFYPVSLDVSPDGSRLIRVGFLVSQTGRDRHSRQQRDDNSRRGAWKHGRRRIHCPREPRRLPRPARHKPFHLHPQCTDERLDGVDLRLHVRHRIYP